VPPANQAGSSGSAQTVSANALESGRGLEVPSFCPNMLRGVPPSRGVLRKPDWVHRMTAWPGIRARRARMAALTTWASSAQIWTIRSPPPHRGSR
jgi:hypothetical protein